MKVPEVLQVHVVRVDSSYDEYYHHVKYGEECYSILEDELNKRIWDDRSEGVLDYRIETHVLAGAVNDTSSSIVTCYARSIIPLSASRADVGTHAHIW